MTTEADLDARRIILLRDVIKSVLPISMSMLRQRMAHMGIPIVMLGERKSGILLTDLDRLIAGSKQEIVAPGIHQ